ncbi:hypothetical protein O2W18_15390 [Modestobacter sp. VKM Ac-2983]|uniref:DUF6541 family protein n=1 Tax=Modestobacter sp. VKM Ac-2983 TaxID=3004137 RepID=UPI0022AB904F|nr:DUF6541 family protein [Modestobacter sp. VKM Ac-2983]MCZ2806493.1 hypothetical protein [Modestobacter sp. VKM Ac-2983]
MFVVVPVLFFVPGLVVAAVLGLRGWRLAAVAPALTFGLVATGGPVLEALGVRWSLLSLGLWTAAIGLLLAGVSWLWTRRRGTRGVEAPNDGEGPVPRPLREHLLVGGGVVLGMAVGALTFLRGTGGLDVTHQDWDAPFHANAVRWIADHGQAVPSAIAPIANVPAGDPYFYPVTYHSLLAIVVQLFDAAPSWVLNAAALTVVMIWPLGIAALGLSWRIPAPVVAVAALVSTWFTAFPYDSLSRGPLWPFVAGLALLPGVLAAGRLLLERTPAVRSALVVALGVTGVVAMHPSLAFVLLVYVLALAVALLLRLEPVRWRAAAVPLALTGVFTVLVLLPVVLPARTASGGVQAARWDEFATQAEGFGQVLLYSPVIESPQWWLGLTAIVGMVVMVLRRRLLWVLAAYLVLGAAYAATASMDTAWVNILSGPFYNDAWRLAAALPLAGALAVGTAVVAFAEWLAPRLRLGGTSAGPVGVTAAAVVVLALLANGAYVDRNVSRLAVPYADGPTVSEGEREAYEWLADHVRPGEQVMNDRLDGSVWMYSYAGVEPMVFTFYGPPAGSVADRLQERLNQLDTSAAVRRMVEEANVRYVFLGGGFIREGMQRIEGLRDLDAVDGLKRVFANESAIVYEVVPSGGDPEPAA